ncbi:hypothetical protein [Solirubrobacter soli]|uniref:hypothetical protein n=1 Tax=Solirubrobacter soli TaxID=363832 RepID=UPI000422E744|nr:hypothetical protein [Solirubrobacter soli]
MSRRLLGATAALTLVGCAAAGCGSVASPAPAAVSAAGATVTAPAALAAPAATPTAPSSPVDAVAAIARRQYDREVNGAKAHSLARRVAADAGLLRVLHSGDRAAARAYVATRFATTWYHWHVSRVRVSMGGHVIAERGVPFVVAGPSITVRGLGIVQISLQDEIGFVRLMHRNHHVEVVVRGQTAGHVRSSLPAATRQPLPASGTTVVAGRRYAVRTIHERAWNGEPVTVWLLRRA